MAGAGRPRDARVRPTADQSGKLDEHSLNRSPAPAPDLAGVAPGPRRCRAGRHRSLPSQCPVHRASARTSARQLEARCTVHRGTRCDSRERFPAAFDVASPIRRIPTTRLPGYGAFRRTPSHDSIGRAFGRPVPAGRRYRRYEIPPSPSTSWHESRLPWLLRPADPGYEDRPTSLQSTA
jgi:hypothetical protein